MARTVLEVFLSSTAADLKPHREAVYARLARIEFIKCIRQEDFGAQNAGAAKYCCERAGKADLFVGLIGMRRGWEPDGDKAQRSITEMEYESAKEAGRGRYVWVSLPEFFVPGNLRESDKEHARQLAFRKRVMDGGERIVSQKGFESPDALASEIVEQLLAHVVTGDLIKLLRPELGQVAIAPVEDQKPAIAAAVEKLAEDKDVDLLALAKNPQGVDLADLEAKLKARAETHEAAGQKENKRSAEYWRHIGALAFLHNTQKALTAYQKAALLDPQDADALRLVGELQYRLGDLPAAYETFLALASLGQRNKDSRAESMGYMRLGWVHRIRGELDQSESAINKGLQLAESAGWTAGMASAYGNLGLIHRRRGEIGKAEEMYRKALASNEELDSKLGMATAYANLGVVYQSRGQLDKADEVHRKALVLSEQLGSKEEIANAYGNLGNIQMSRGEIDTAEEMQRKALALNEQLGRKEGMAIAYANLGGIQSRRGDLKKAEEMQRKALALNEEVGDKEGMAIAYHNLGIIYADRSDKIHMCDCWRKERDIWREMNLNAKAAEIEHFLKINACPGA